MCGAETAKQMLVEEGEQSEASSKQKESPEERDDDDDAPRLKAFVDTQTCPNIAGPRSFFRTIVSCRHSCRSLS